MREEKEHTCQFCYYEYFDGRAYPCSMCVCGEERKDMFQPKGRQNKRKDEPQTEDWQDWKDQMWTEAIVTEPQPTTDCRQTDCYMCKWLGEVDVCGRCRNGNLFAEADTEPQTDCSWK